MANFQDYLKAKQENMATMSIRGVENTMSTMVATPMTLSLEDESGMIAAYSGEEFNRADMYQNNVTQYEWYEEYYDDKYSIINNQKIIKLSEDQINLTQEANSQVIPFMMDRYYDGVDLMKMTISIYFVNKNGQAGENPVINVEYSDTKIRFYWLLNDLPTAIAGKLKIEIRAMGFNEKGAKYLWRTQTNEEINILESLVGDGIIEPGQGWNTYIEIINNNVLQAQKASTEAKSAAQEAINAIDVIDEKINTVSDTITAQVMQDFSDELANFYTKEQTNTLIDNIDISDQLKGVEDRVEDLEIEFASFDGLANLSFDFVKDTKTLTAYNGEDVIDALVLDIDPSVEWVTAYDTKIDGKISTAVGTVQTNLDNYKTQTDADLQSIHDSIDDLPSTLQTDYYNKEAVDGLLSNKADSTTINTLNTKVGVVETTANNNKSDIAVIGTKVAEIAETLGNMNQSQQYTYDIKYNDIEDADVGENVFAFYEIQNEGQENEVREIKQKFTIVGGSGGGSSSSLKITYVTTSPVIATVNDKMFITYNFSGTDSSGDIVPEGNYTWKIGTKIIASGIAYNGENTFEVTDFATTTEQTFTLSITTDEGRSLATKQWKVKKIDVKLESNFNDTYQYNGDVSFNYTPYGTVEKDIHFKLDGKEIGVVKTSTSGIPASYTIPAQTHGSHLLEVYMTTTVNNVPIESNHIYKDIVWCDPNSSIPVIGCATPKIDVTQYNTVNIKYTVYDPNTETPTVTWYIGEEVASIETLTEKDAYGYYTYSYKANNEGDFVFTITCGEAEPKVITMHVEKLNINVSPVTAGLEFDFNPVGYSNSSANRLWSHNNITMTVSDNFDWVNGGYQIDENGDQYFCVKAGTNAIINYNLFADDPKKNGKEFKLIFRTKNIRKRDTSFLNCMNDGIGLDMKVEYATVYDSTGSLKNNYCEDTIIEYEFNINKYADMPIVMSYEDGTPGKPYEYKETSSFKQETPQPITIGSADCDIHIYRMKAYSISLTDTDIKNNFIADARNADEMIARYNRNNIYNENGALVSTSASGDFNVDALTKAAPDLRYVFIEVPYFTWDKDIKIDNCNVYFRYPNGTRPHDNWDCTGVRHRGQGTSSNLYGYSGRNIDICMDRDESLFTYVDEEGNTVESSTITLTDTSVPTDYLNIKLNIASSENANNAEMARRFNEYQPFLRYARKKDSKVKDTMEFYNCVVFIRETSTDVKHTEFNDNNWHFYGIGNIGDSKKTDDTRVNNKRDPKEHVIEITDADKPLSAFPTGKENHAVCPVSEWKSGNTAYDVLYSNEYVYDEEGAFESFGGKTYEFRYEMKNITPEQRQVNIDTWRDLYTFIVTSSDEEFYANLKNYFVVDSALYYYLFTERYTMVDNRAKNSFWHYGKVYISNAEAAVLGETEASYYIIDDEAAAINDGYRYDLTWGYDFDTALGIDNTGDYVFSYGKEDTDYYVDGDPTSDYVFRVADSVFFCRLRDLFTSEKQAMFKDREEKNAWSSNSLITQWDNSQFKFPEELWRLDYERKYYRTYLGLSIDNSITVADDRMARGIDKTFLIGKFFGRKKYARRAFEINQEMYFATKYFGNRALADRFWIRGNVPIGSTIKPNYSLTLVPYSDMYVCVQYTSTGTPIHIKAKAGQTVFFENNAERMDFIYVYGASFIQEVGDLSRCYVGDNNFSSAIRLQKLVIGSTDVGYENTFMKEVLVENNPLLEYLDLRNVSGINTVINVSGCSNLKELYAEGTNAQGVIFANGGLLETAHLPKIASLSMKNLNYIKDFVVEGYDNLQTLIVENVPSINTYNIVTNSPLLKIARLVGLNWDDSYQIPDGSIFDRLLTIRGIDSSGVYETDISVLTGHANIVIVKEQQAYNYRKAWPDLDIVPENTIPQFAVTFVNADGVVLEVQYVDNGEDAIDPTTRTENRLIPTIPSTVSHDFTFDKWDTLLTKVFSDRVITATYTSSLRNYTLKYVSKNGQVMQESTGKYGDIILYKGADPVYTAEEAAPAYTYYLFSHWDKSGYVNGDKTITAVFDKCKYVDGYFNGKDLSTMRPVEIYALTKLSKLPSAPVSAKNILFEKDTYSFTLGYDIDFEDIESEEIISTKTSFTGVNHIDTGIKLFDVDKDFVLAIDYEFLSGCSSNAVLAECFQTNGSNGFQLSYMNSNANIKWGAQSSKVASLNGREMIVLRHRKGENNLTVYNSNLDSTVVSVIELERSYSTICNSTLVFGATKPEENSYENHAIGDIHWCKIWYQDLGDDICKKLAIWTHEKCSLEVSGFNRYYLTEDPNSRCTFSLLGSHLLERDRAYNIAQSNSGGWAASDLNSFLNKRLRDALPSQIKALVKQVTVTSSIGDKSTELSTSECYITIPAYVDVCKTDASPYYSEGKLISYMTNNDARKRAYDGGEYHSYWLRSPNIPSTTTSNGYYVWQVDATGAMSGFSTPTSKSGVLIEISI